MNNIGFIGLGLMGEPMARHLLKSQKQVGVLGHIRRDPIDRLIQLGAWEAPSIEELASRSDIVFLMLPSSDEVVEVCQKGLLKNLKSSSIVIDCTTGSPESAMELAKEFSLRGVSYLDAPVTGGKKGAEEAQLTIMVGGDQKAFELVKPLLAILAKTIVHMGPSGHGLKAKLVNNYVCLANLMVASEAVVWAKELDLNLSSMVEILKSGTGASRQLELYGESLLNRDFSPRFKQAHGLKDLRLAEKLGQSMGVQPLLLAQVKNAYELSNDQPEDNVSTVLRSIEKLMVKKD